MKLSVIIPAYNEAQRISPTLERVSGYLGAGTHDVELLVVDDGSADETPALVREWSARQPMIRLLRNGVNMGKGASVRNGILASVGEQVLISDADLSTPIEEIEKLRAALHEGYDVAIGSRGLRGADIALRQPWYREYMGKTFNLLVKLLLFRGIEDTQCGFKLLRREAARNIFSRCRVRGFGFDVEALFLARKMGYRIKEVPIRWENSPASKVRIPRDPAFMFLELVMIRLNWLFGLYGV
jgi:dolichyl-phosphate beta-glucosyltransferase